MVHEVAARLGLVPASDGHAGVIDGVAVTVSSQLQRDPTHLATARIEPPLDLGLRIARAQVAYGGFTGDPDFDAETRATADDEERARLLLTGPVRREIIGATVHRADFAIDDAEVRLYETDMDGLEVAVRAAVRLAKVFDEARAEVPAAKELLDAASSWRAFAAAHRLDFSETPLRIGGLVDGVALRGRALRTGPRKFDTTIEARFAEPLGLGLAIEPQGFMKRVMVALGAGDVRVGDDVFDDRFHVRCREPQRAVAALNAEARAAMLELAACGEVRVDDTSATLRSLRPIAAHLLGVLATLPGALARGLLGAAVGPYR